MRVYVVSTQLHDAIVARISHLPHLAAALICDTAADFDINLLPYSGPGFRDTTRVASGSPQIWESIITDNRAEILPALGEFSERLGRLVKAIESSDMQAVSEILKRQNRLGTSSKNYVNSNSSKTVSFQMRVVRASARLQEPYKPCDDTGGAVGRQDAP